MKYESKKESTSTLLLTGACVFLLTPLLLHFSAILPVVTPVIILYAILIIFGILFVWINFSTFYVIEGELLHIYSGPIRKHIPLSCITSLKPNVVTYSGMRLALSSKMIEVNYNNNTVYISPVKENEFIFHLTGLNSSITIK